MRNCVFALYSAVKRYISFTRFEQERSIRKCLLGEFLSRGLENQFHWGLSALTLTIIVFNGCLVKPRVELFQRGKPPKRSRLMRQRIEFLCGPAATCREFQSAVHGDNAWCLRDKVRSPRQDFPCIRNSRG